LLFDEATIYFAPDLPKAIVKQSCATMGRRLAAKRWKVADRRGARRNCV